MFGWKNMVKNRNAGSMGTARVVSQCGKCAHRKVAYMIKSLRGENAGITALTLQFRYYFKVHRSALSSLPKSSSRCKYSIGSLHEEVPEAPCLTLSNAYRTSSSDVRMAIHTSDCSFPWCGSWKQEPIADGPHPENGFFCVHYNLPPI